MRLPVRSVISVLAVAFALSLALAPAAFALESQEFLQAGTVSLATTQEDETNANPQDSSVAITDISGAAIKVKDVVYSGSAAEPGVKVALDGKTLVKDRDFTVKYSSNKKVGTATVTVRGKGAFIGTAKAHFKVKKAKASKFKVAAIEARTYTGKLFKPRPKVTFNGKKLKLGRDYKLSYKSNKNVGVAKVVIQGKGNFKGKKTVTFRIKKPAAAKRQSASASSSTSGTVYWVPKGKVYHLSRSCRSLARSHTILSGTIAESGMPRACKNCS